MPNPRTNEEQPTQSPITVERVLKALSREPMLMWELMMRARVYGPWEFAPNKSHSMMRWDPFRRTRVTLRLEGFVWVLKFLGKDTEVEVRDIGGNGTPMAKILQGADAHLRAADYILIDEEETPL